MKIIKNILIIALLLLISCQPRMIYRTENIPIVSEKIITQIKSIYDSTELKDKLDYNIFRMAMMGFDNIDAPKKNIISIIDYSQPSTNKRYYLIDLENNKLLFNTLIAHGKNSGENMATVFSNVPESKISSIGFFIAAEAYEGSNGYSLRIDGIEKDINHNARKRDIVIHKADYVSQNFIKQEGRLGRSWGCPALPNEVSHQIIDIIKDGSCIFVYGEDENYLKNSKYIEKR